VNDDNKIVNILEKRK